MLWPDATGVSVPCADVAVWPDSATAVAGESVPLAAVAACPVKAKELDGVTVP